MPTVGLNRDDLYERLGKSYTLEEFELLCFEFGVELDDVTSEWETARKMGMDEAAMAAKGLSKKTEYAIDVPANRYDLLCMEGMARALRVFLGLERPPPFSIVEPAKRLTMNVDSASTDTIRPFCVCAVLRGVSFEDDRVYESFIDLQDKLHQNICRRRTLVAIGTHDLSTLAPEFFYAAEKPADITFVPLQQERAFGAKELLDHYRTDVSCKHLKPYTGIIYDSPLYPVIRDASGAVLSLPPVINGAHSRIRRTTRDVFIECTATDETKANVVCNTVVAMFSEYCGFRVEPVDVVYRRDGKIVRTMTTPVLAPRSMSASLAEIRGVVGLSESELPAADACALAEKMQLSPATYDAATDTLTVAVPVTRSDIMHAVDVAEDVAIAYGYNNIPERLPSTTTTGGPTRLNAFSDLLRDEVARAGYVEILTHGLCKMEEQFERLGHGDRENERAAAVTLSNPASEDFEIVRTSLLVGALKTLQCSKAHTVRGGLKLFEVSDVVFADETSDVGATNRRKLVATYTGATAGFEVIHGLLDRIMACSRVAPNAAVAANSIKNHGAAPPTAENVEYRVVPRDDPTFFPGRSATILLSKAGVETEIGTFGVVHPTVLANFEIDYPTSALEIDVEALAGTGARPPCGC